MPNVGDTRGDGALVWLKKQCRYHAQNPDSPVPHPAGCICTGGWHLTIVEEAETQPSEPSEG